MQDDKFIFMNNLLLLIAIISTTAIDVGGDGAESVKYITNDGIQVLREDFEGFVENQNMELQKDLYQNLKNKKHRNIEEEIYEREFELQEVEDKNYSHKLPKRCHVCKIFAEEFQHILEKKSTKDEEGTFIYEPSLLSEALEEVCVNMKLYAVTRISSFRYKKGNSLMRHTFNEAQKGSKIKAWSYTLSPSQIDDPTGEIERLTEKCIKLTNYHGRKNILRWYQEHSNIPLVDWFCRDIYLKNNRKECLTKTIKKDFKQAKDEL